MVTASFNVKVVDNSSVLNFGDAEASMVADSVYNSGYLSLVSASAPSSLAIANAHLNTGTLTIGLGDGPLANDATVLARGVENSGVINIFGCPAAIRTRPDRRHRVERWS